jgi:photosystem II stability/assembly factor-like uncharacterized protein
VDNQYGYGLGMLSNSRALLRTEDGGDTWENMCRFPKGLRPVMLTFVSRSTGWILASPDEEPDKTVILRTLDGGESWVSLESGISQLKVYFADYFKFFDLNNGLLIAKKSESTAFYQTSDGGRTWKLSEQKLPKGISQYSFVSEKLGWEMRTSFDDDSVNLYETTDGSTWQLLKQIGTNTYSYGVEIISENKGCLLIEKPKVKPDNRKELLITTDGGKTWYSYLFPDGFKLETIKSQIPMQFMDDGHGWILTTYGLLSTEDGGKTWIWK